MQVDQFKNICFPFLCAFSSFFFFLTEKDVKMSQKMITSREWRSKHLLGGQNTQHECSCQGEWFEFIQGSL